MASDFSLESAITNEVNGTPGYANEIQKAIDQTDLYTLQADLNEIKERAIVYYFDIIRSHRVQLQAQITDYWLENSTAVQDSINISPIIITLTGLVGEVVFKAPIGLHGRIANALKSKFPQLGSNNAPVKLGAMSGLFPKVDNYVQLAKNASNYADAVFTRYKKIWEQIQNWRKGVKPDLRTMQQRVYENLRDFWINKVPMVVNTPYGEFNSMYIQNVTIEQGETNTVSNITVTLKQLKFASVGTGAVNKNEQSLYNQQAKASTEDIGNAKTKNKDLKSILKGGLGILSNKG